MAQEADLTETGTNEAEEERNRRSGRDIPGGTGVVGDEDINAVGDANEQGDKPTGQDHSTEDYAETMPDHGVGAVQDHSDTTSDVARIKE